MKFEAKIQQYRREAKGIIEKKRLHYDYVTNNGVINTVMFSIVVIFFGFSLLASVKF